MSTADKHTWIIGTDSHVNFHAYEDGYHNGPRCAVCGFYFCCWCEPDHYDDECDGQAPIPGSPARLSTAGIELLESSVLRVPSGGSDA
jgi:hypothetical protein